MLPKTHGLGWTAGHGQQAQVAVYLPCPGSGLQTVSAETLHSLPSWLERALISTLVIDTDTCTCVYKRLITYMCIAIENLSVYALRGLLFLFGFGCFVFALAQF